MRTPPQRAGSETGTPPALTEKLAGHVMFSADAKGQVVLDLPPRFVVPVEFEATGADGLTGAGTLELDSGGEFPRRRSSSCTPARPPSKPPRPQIVAVRFPSENLRSPLRESGLPGGSAFHLHPRPPFRLSSGTGWNRSLPESRPPRRGRSQASGCGLRQVWPRPASSSSAAAGPQEPAA